ncbi:MAG: hypothetical protein GXX89_03605 [Clostridiales bacterium]|jgi:hypothetical protein|nr:hypothetical protein [Clostridiales bacterium]
MEERKWLCGRCGGELVKRKTLFEYMGRTFSENILNCPKCSMVLIPSDLALGRMAEVEEILEDK